MMKTNPVRQALADLGAGRLSPTDAITALEKSLVPVHRFAPAASIDETYLRMNADAAPPWTPGSWDEVDLAVAQGVISVEQAFTLRSKVTCPPATIVALAYS